MVKTRIYIFTGLGLIFLGLTVFIGTQISANSQKIKLAQKELVKQASNLDALDQLLLDRKNYDAQIQILRQSLPKSYQEIANYTEYIEQLTTINNQILETNIDETTRAEDTPGLLSLEYKIKTEGSRLDFNQLLSLLADLPYHTKINSIKVDTVENQATTLTTYKLYMPELISPPSSEIPRLNTQTITKLANEISENRLKGGEFK